MAAVVAEQEIGGHAEPGVLRRPLKSGARRTRPAERMALGLGLSALSALLATWSFPPYGLWPLTFVAWVPMLVAQHHVLPRRQGWLAVAVGIGGYCAGYLHGIIGVGFAWWVIWIPVAGGLAAGLGAAAERRRQEAGGYALFIIAFPLAWAAGEFLRGFVPGVGTQGYVAYALFREPWLLQPISIVGTSALNLLILLVNWTIGLAVLVALDRMRTHPSRFISIRVLTTSTVVSAGLAGLWLAASLCMFRVDPPTVTVAALQPGLHTPGPVDLHRDVAQTRMAGKAGAKLVVWQEGTLWFRPQGTALAAQLSALARQNHVYLVIGYRFVTRHGQHNDTTVIAPSGRYLGVYGKQHPAVMFADDQTSLDAGSMPVYRTPFGRLATMICFDADFTDTARSAAIHGAQILAVPSQDPAGDAMKHYGLLVFRAIENRLTVVKGEFSYDSVVIDPYGRILAAAVAPQGRRATVLARVPLGSGKSPWVSFGDLWGWLIVAAAVTAMIGTAVVARRKAAPCVP